MALIYRKIHVRIWNDEKFLELDPIDKLAFFALLTHPCMTPMGAGVLTGAMADEIVGNAPGYCFRCSGGPDGGIGCDDREHRGEGSLERLREAGLILRDNYLIIVKNVLLYNCPENYNQLAGWIEVCEGLPRSKAFTELKAHLLSASDELPDWLYTTLLNPLSEQQNRGLRSKFYIRLGGTVKPSPQGSKKPSSKVSPEPPPKGSLEGMAEPSPQGKWEGLGETRTRTRTRTGTGIKQKQSPPRRSAPLPPVTATDEPPATPGGRIDGNTVLEPEQSQPGTERIEAGIDQKAPEPGSSSPVAALAVVGLVPVPRPMFSVFQAWTEGFKARFDAKPQIDRKRDPGILKGLVDRYGGERVCAMIQHFFASSDPWIRGSSYTVPAFASQVNKLLVESGRPRTPLTDAGIMGQNPRTRRNEEIIARTVAQGPMFETPEQIKARVLKQGIRSG